MACLHLSIHNPEVNPKEVEAFNREAAALTESLEGAPVGTVWSEEDQLICHSLVGDFWLLDSPKTRRWCRKTLAKFSTQFPTLVLALDVRGDDSPDSQLFRREYFHDGYFQETAPVVTVTVPEFDPALAEQLVMHD